MTEKDQEGCKVYRGVWSRNIQDMKCVMYMAENTPMRILG